MNRAEAQAVLAEQLGSYRTRSYAELVAMIGKPARLQCTGGSGQSYQTEVEVFWDGMEGGDVRVLAASFRAATRPLTADFIKPNDGNFVGED